MNREKWFVPNNITIKKTRFQKFSNLIYLTFFWNAYFLHNVDMCFAICYIQVSVDAFSLLYSKLLHAKLSQFFLMPLLLNCIGKLSAYVAALFVTSVCRLLSLRSWLDNAWVSKSLDCSRSQIRILHVADFFLLSRGIFLIFLISLDRAALWPCSRKCLRSAASPLCFYLW